MAIRNLLWVVASLCTLSIAEGSHVNLGTIDQNIVASVTLSNYGFFYFLNSNNVCTRVHSNVTIDLGFSQFVVSSRSLTIGQALN